MTTAPGELFLLTMWMMQVKVTVMMTNMEDYKKINEVYKECRCLLVWKETL